MKTDEEILAELRRATHGLFVMSESDYPFETLSLKGEIDLTEQHLREIAAADADAPVETGSVEEFFDSTMFETDWKRREASGDATELASLLKENLTELRVYRIGKINIPVFIIGKSSEGNWLGLSTRVVET